MTPFQKIPRNAAAKTKNPLDLLRQRAKKCLISDLLSTPQSTRRMMAVMVTMGVVNENHERKE
jgi:hypothetical protein